MLINKNTYFIHIPRTAGKYITFLFKANNFVVTLDEFDNKWNNKEIPHLTFPDYEIFLNFLQCKKFTVVREPVDRFLSAINSDVKLNPSTLEKMFKDQETFNMYLNNLIFNDDSNWYLPQINFINYDTKIYKYENGLGTQFIKWLEENFNFKIEKYDSRPYENIYEINLSDKQKQFVKNYYYKDYKILNY